jgi:purine nucleosidase
MSESEFKRTFTSEIFKPVHDFAEIWFNNFYRFVAFHDPLTAACLFDANLCSFVRGDVSIELSGNKYKGLTRIKKNQKGKHEVASSVDQEKFFEHFISVCGG